MLLGQPSRRRLGRAALKVDRIRCWEQEFSRLSDSELLYTALTLRGRARGGWSLNRLLPEAFGLVCAAAQRTIGLRPFDVQLAGGVVLHEGALAELATGEGKTLVAALPAFLNALVGKGVHITTVNDYLAARDRDWMQPIYSALGLTAGVIQMQMPEPERALAYRCDITYGTASEFGFDCLRDRLRLAGDKVFATFLEPWNGGGAQVDGVARPESSKGVGRLLEAGKGDATPKSRVASSFQVDGVARPDSSKGVGSLSKGATPFEDSGRATRPALKKCTANGVAGQPLEPTIQHGHHFALVDEADSIFIDEARTPLIIAAPTRLATPEEALTYQWADQVVRTMKPEVHFTLDPKTQTYAMTEAGQRHVRYAAPPSGPRSDALDELHDRIEQALHAHHRLCRDQHYMVEKGSVEKGSDPFPGGKVTIVDEYTGRRMPDRHWREGLHQAVEAKEGAPITFRSDHAAQITLQSYFRLYEKLSGMTGTAAQNWYEIRRVYKIWVVPVPTNRAVNRKQWPDRVFPNEDAKFAAVVQEVARLQQQGRPVLIGTRSVEKSEKLSRMLEAAGIEHQVLNAKQHIREADIIARAGHCGRVTIATNMAGRGTDIKLTPEVVAAGGLHVLGTERHDARRIDRQLAGRAGRQGDPGSCQFFLALEDELLEGLGPKRQAELRKLGAQGGEGNWQKYRRLFLRAQRRIERRHRRERVDLMVYERNRQEILKDLGADPYVD
jgi:preprotein translocase subunit SecA